MPLTARLHLDAHNVLLIGFGLLALLVAWLPLYLSRLPLSLPIVCLALGFLALAEPGPLTGASIDRLLLMERLTEAVLIIAVLGAGLSLDRPIGLHRWASTWRLLGIAMPLGFAILALLAVAIGHFSVATALLIAAVLSPTDPVLASDLRVGPPGTGEEGEVRQALTSEAGLNDGLAAPFVLLALAVNQGARIDAMWILDHAIFKVAIAVVIGWVLGRTFGWFQFKVPGIRDSDTADGLAAIGAGLFAYGVTEALGGYGFVAVFLTAIRLRESKWEDKAHRHMVEFANQVEHLIAMCIVVVFAGAVANGLLAQLTWSDALLVALLLLVVRPLTAFVSLLGTPHPFLSRAATAFFGIRGIGTLYYLLYALQKMSFPEQPRLVAVAGAAVFASIILHGITATPVMRRLDRIRTARARTEATGDDRH
ncbi:MAG TPA: cation:proton antiporter [Steroidobacteraceae bacterium]|nr:cation:proton antiporter [Steroidobacteraceae bacterium]